VSEERNIGQILAWLPPRLSPYSPNPARHRVPHIQPPQNEVLHCLLIHSSHYLAPSSPGPGLAAAAVVVVAEAVAAAELVSHSAAAEQAWDSAAVLTSVFVAAVEVVSDLDAVPAPAGQLSGHLLDWPESLGFALLPGQLGVVEHFLRMALGLLDLAL